MKPLKIGTSFEVSFSPDGGRLATASRGVSIWDLARRAKAVRAHPFSHPSHLDFSPDGATLAVKSTSGRIAILSAESGETVADFGNARDGEGSGIAHSACGTYLVDGAWAGFLSVRRAATGEREFLREFRGEMITGVYRSADGIRWIVAHQRKWTPGMAEDEPLPARFSLWDWPFRMDGCRFFVEHVHANDSAALTADGTLLAVTEDVGPKKLSVYDVATGIRLESVPVDRGGTQPALCWSPDRRFIGSVQNERIIFYCYPGLAKVCEAPLVFPCAVAFSPDGTRLAMGSWEQGWALSTAELSQPRILLKHPARKKPANRLHRPGQKKSGDAE